MDLLPNGDAATLTAWVRPGHGAGGGVLVSDDADPFKTAADENGLLQQICKSHVVRNTEAWMEQSPPRWRAMPMARWRLGVTPTRRSPIAKSCCG